MVSLTESSACLNQTRFEELWAENKAGIRRYLCSLKVEAGALDELMHETSIALWRKFEAYDSSRPFAPWACRFAFLQYLKHRQRRTRDRHVFGDEQLENVPAEWDQESDFSLARRDALRKSIALLDESDRQLLHCRYHSKESVRQMAKRRAISIHKLYHSLDSIKATLRIAVDGSMMSEGWARSELF